MIKLDLTYTFQTYTYTCFCVIYDLVATQMGSHMTIMSKFSYWMSGMFQQSPFPIYVKEKSESNGVQFAPNTMTKGYSKIGTQNSSRLLRLNQNVDF